MKTPYKTSQDDSKQCSSSPSTPSSLGSPRTTLRYRQNLWMPLASQRSPSGCLRTCRLVLNGRQGVGLLGGFTNTSFDRGSGGLLVSQGGLATDFPFAMRCLHNGFGMSNLNSPTKRRWLQFSLRTLLLAVTFAAVGLGWWRHRQFCLARAVFHDDMRTIYLLRGEMARSGGQGKGSGVSSLYSYSTWKADFEKCQSEAARHGTLHEEFRLAIWRPWIRWSIKEPASDLEYQTRLNS